MTRFARASGSKGSNEKRPEDATPWQEMKTEMVKKTVKKKKKESENDLNEQQPEDATSWQDMKTAMAPKIKEKEKDEIEDEDIPTTEEIQNVWAQLVSETEEKIKKKKTGKKKISTDKQQNEVTGEKKKRKAKDDGMKPTKKKRESVNNDDQVLPVKKKKKAKQLSNVNDIVPVQELPENKEKELKVTEKKEKKRRKEALKPAELMINGKPVKVAPFDGFIVQADDAARLRELRKNMKSKGIPEEEREKAIKLERRRAEKALARIRKKVCFHCRSTGHNLSECPQIESEQRATGICYKCGSTEHTHFQCKVGFSFSCTILFLKNILGYSRR